MAKGEAAVQPGIGDNQHQMQGSERRWKSVGQRMLPSLAVLDLTGSTVWLWHPIVATYYIQV
jgi:hypothetical protein